MTQPSHSAGPLAGIRVIDLTSIVMGPLATQLLADLGADVIKIEPPEGDVLRKIGAPAGSTVGPLFMHLNRNKRSVVLDLKSEKDHAVLLDLVRDADVFAHSMRPQAMARLGLSYTDLRAVNSQLIYAGMFGFSQTGPSAEDAAFDDLIQAASGIADLMGRTTDGRPGYVPFNMADRSVGLLAFGAISAALAGRARTGKGCEIGIPMYETLTGLVLGDHLFGETAIPASGPMGYQRITVRDRGPYPTVDGHICTMIYTDPQWRTFLRLIGRDDNLASDPRLKDIAARTRHAGELFEFISDHTRSRPTDEWIERLTGAGLPAIAMRRIEDLLSDPQLTASGFFKEVDHPTQGSVRLMRCPVEITGQELQLRHLPPELGADTVEVLAEINARQQGKSA